MKKQKTFTIDENVWNKYNELSIKKSINKSLQIENYMKDMINLYENDENFIIYGDVKILSYKKRNGDIFKINENL